MQEVIYDDNEIYRQPDQRILGLVHRQAHSLARVERVGLPLSKKSLAEGRKKAEGQLEKELDAFYALPLVKKASSST